MQSETQREAEISIAKSDLELDLIEKIEPVLLSLGYQLRDVEVIGAASNATIRVTLERAHPQDEADENQEPGGIGIEDCTRVHENLGPMFDVWDPLPGAYTLEVSSPGEKPSLRLLRHFKEALGEEIKFQTVEALPMPEPLKPRRNWGGILKSVDPVEGAVSVSDSYGEHIVPLAQIKSANWLRDWGTTKPEPGKSKGRKEKA